MTLFRLLFLMILVHSLVYSHIHTDSYARHYLDSYFYWFLRTAWCTAIFILILMHDTI